MDLIDDILNLTRHHYYGIVPNHSPRLYVAPHVNNMAITMQHQEHVSKLV